MKKIFFALLLSTSCAFPAMAADQSKLSAGAGVGFDYVGVFSIHADYDISDKADNEPVKVRFGYDRYSRNYSGPANYSWGYNDFYAAALYDLNKSLKLDSRVHPFAGLGLGFGSTSCSGNGCGGASNPSVGGIYFIAGLQYDVKPKFNVEVNVNSWVGLTVGANFKF